jgi:hypothetical protein
MDYIIISAADDSYINTIIDFIQCFPCDKSKLILYDLGFNEINLKLINQLKFKYNFSLKKLNYSNYPEHVDLKKYNGIFCSYAFKPIIIYNEANEEYNKNKIIIWMDSANRFTINNINEIIKITNLQGIYSPISANKNTIESIELNNHQTTNYYNLTDYEHKNMLESISANLVSINYASEAGYTIINNWYKDSLNKEIIMPNNTNRNNNRQDQTILSILMYLYQKKNNINFYKDNVGVEFWKKKDEFKIPEGVFPFKLFNKNGNQLAIIYCRTINEAIFTYSNRKKMSTQEFLQNYIVISG